MSEARVPIRLVAPAETYRDGFLSALREFRAEGLPWWVGPDTDLAARDFPAFVAQRLADAHPPGGTQRRDDAQPPKTHLWAVTVADARVVGRIAIFHALTDALRVAGGHIGYDTVPSMRGHGIASEMLRRALPIAYALGLSEVLITCDNTNAASIRVIEKNGGVLHDTRVIAADRPLKRYYRIALG